MFDTSRARRCVVAALPLMIVLSACGPSGGSPDDQVDGDGACAAPRTVASPTTASPGQTVTVTAENLWDGCNDQGDQADPLPLTDQLVTWSQGGRVVDFGTVDADADTGTAEASIVIPTDAASGTSAIAVGHSEPASISISASE